MRTIPQGTAMSMDAYRNQAKVLVRSYLLADPYIPYTAVLGGIIAFKMKYSLRQNFQWYFPGRSYLGCPCPKGLMVLVACDLTHLISIFYFKCYSGLTKIQRTEWNNRGMSTIHALFITIMSLYFVFWSNLFSDQGVGLMAFRSSALSTFTLGVSVGYFLSDLAVICWFYPSLGGMEYVIHHSLSGIAVAYSMFSGEGQLYTFMVLISEVTTPEINMRWFLETAGMKKSLVYLINGVLIFLAWLVARILLFGYLFYHVYLHYHQIIQMHIFGYFLVFVVPFALAVMNLRWFTKIVKGVKKTLSKKQRTISV